MNHEKSDRVRVYFNLTKKCYSVQTLQSGKWKLLYHTDKINLSNVKFVCSHATRLRVIAEGKKYVHAYFEGNVSNTVVNPHYTETHYGHFVTYNPYKFPNEAEHHFYPVYSYGDYCDRSVINSFWDMWTQSPRKDCQFLTMRINEKKPVMIAAI